MSHPAWAEGLVNMIKSRLYGHLLLNAQTRVWRLGHSWRGKDKLKIDVLQWTTTHWPKSFSRLPKAYFPQLNANIKSRLESWPGAMAHRGWWRERERIKGICADGPTWWYICIYIYIFHPQTDCFVASHLFSVVRHAIHSKLGSKPTYLYVRIMTHPEPKPTSKRQLGNYIYIYVYIYIYNWLIDFNMSTRLGLFHT